MGPYTQDINTIFKEEVTREEQKETVQDQMLTRTDNRRPEIITANLITFAYGHIAALYGLYLCFTSAKWETILFAILLCICSELGITAGAHRLWCHRAYKAKLPLQLILLLFNTLAFQNTAIHWVRDHRMHHKYSDTDADPHNATRGFFFSHVGWLLCGKHEKVKNKGKDLDMSDIYGNPLLRFQKKYAIPFVGLVSFIIPTLIPIYFWNETLNNSWHVATMLRYVTCLNITFLVNSAAHIWGNKPYDKALRPAQNLAVSVLALGEGFHNYHHVFPWDYRTAELGNNYLNLTTLFIDFFAKIGWAYDLRTVSADMIGARSQRTGDGSNSWGWEELNMKKKDTMVMNPSK